MHRSYKTHIRFRVSFSLLIWLLFTVGDQLRLMTTPSVAKGTSQPVAIAPAKDHLSGSPANMSLVGGSTLQHQRAFGYLPHIHLGVPVGRYDGSAPDMRNGRGFYQTKGLSNGE